MKKRKESAQVSASEVLSYNVAIEVIIIILGLSLPIVLIFFAKLGASEFIEEIAKGLVIAFVITRLPLNKMRIGWSFWFGSLFGLSESMLYLTNILLEPGFSAFWKRLLITVPLHIITALIIIGSIILGRSRKWAIVGVIVAIVVHVIFNSVIFGLA